VGHDPDIPDLIYGYIVHEEVPKVGSA